ncbi:hypothetical protein B7R54_08385 [Subtercola boreus]|uniref:HEAT repeat domain-containing protein n=1 Tax=Subtercola boreus TaxID=120213 RepID=A0A3E0VHP3_9MICO|nr:HEAT repeat domain-containing protein [Subtercola boreus]RFA09241.1 hypothetical protein B7R54_08385 [Subtercola boreus]TQL53733.1 HEAT repeat protein [Subtercola boreus]
MSTEPTPDLNDPIEARLDEAVAREGAERVARRATSLLAGRYEGEEFLLVVGGTHAEGIVNGAPALYWPEVWGARALLYVWDDAATPTVIGALTNQSWRVREMAARVCAAHGVGTARDLVKLTTDQNPRVRAAAARAIAAVGEAPSIQSLEAMLRDRDKDVRRAAQQSIVTLKGRLGE